MKKPPEGDWIKVKGRSHVVSALKHAGRDLHPACPVLKQSLIGGSFQPVRSSFGTSATVMLF
jgi:hypothetical protein